MTKRRGKHLKRGVETTYLGEKSTEKELPARGGSPEWRFEMGKRGVEGFL